MLRGRDEIAHAHVRRLKLLVMLLLLFGSCATNRRAKPCSHCPHFTKVSALFLDKVKLNPYPSQISLQAKYDN